MLALIVEFRIKDAHVDAFDAAIRSNARSSVDDEPGCRQFDVCIDPQQAGRFVLYEIYDDEAAFQAHLASAHFREMSALSADWLVGKSVTLLKRVAHSSAPP